MRTALLNRSTATTRATATATVIAVSCLAASCGQDAQRVNFEILLLETTAAVPAGVPHALSLRGVADPERTQFADGLVLWTQWEDPTWPPPGFELDLDLDLSRIPQRDGVFADPVDLTSAQGTARLGLVRRSAGGEVVERLSASELLVSVMALQSGDGGESLSAGQFEASFASGSVVGLRAAWQTEPRPSTATPVEIDTHPDDPTDDTVDTPSQRSGDTGCTCTGDDDGENPPDDPTPPDDDSGSSDDSSSDSDGDGGCNSCAGDDGSPEDDSSDSTDSTDSDGSDSNSSSDDGGCDCSGDDSSTDSTDSDSDSDSESTSASESDSSSDSDSSGGCDCSGDEDTTSSVAAGATAAAAKGSVRKGARAGLRCWRKPLRLPMEWAPVAVVWGASRWRRRRQRE